MKFEKRAFGAPALAVTLVAQCYSQVTAPAPVPLPPCLIYYSYLEPGYGSGSRLMLYNADKTYVEINSVINGVTVPTRTGTFTYVVDPQQTFRAGIQYDGGTGPLQDDWLYFYTANSGANSLPSGEALGGRPFTAFTLYPKQTTNGACNVSNLSQLAGSTGTCGFVVQSGGPRWVLLRASGSSLSIFGVSPTVSSPSFTLYDSTQAVQGTSSVWSSDPNLAGGYQTVFSLVGAFPLKTGSDEGVLLVPLSPGCYTAQFRAGSSATMLFEAYILPF